MNRYYDYTNGISWNSQALGSGVGSVSGGQGKDPLSSTMAARQSMYQHVSGGYAPQDTRSQQMQAQARQNQLYASNMYHGYGATAGTAQLAAIPAPTTAPAMPPFPVHPDIKFKSLPFYDVLAELMKPSTLMPMQAGRMQEGSYIFHLSPQQATDIASGKEIIAATNKLDYVIQAQLRFCLLQTVNEQEDYFPPSVNVKVNTKMCPLPNPLPSNKPTPEPKRPPRPVNITSLIKLSPTVANTINVSWASDFTRTYVISVFMVRKLSSLELLERLKKRGTKSSDFTRQLIREKLSEDYDNEVATTSLRVSLMCPLGKLKMSNPCRSADCTHLQCFDALLFLQMNERRPTWLCPVCNRQAPYESLLVDGYFDEVLTSSNLASDCKEILLHKDGSWSAPIDDLQPAEETQPDADNVTLIADDIEVAPLEGEGVSAKKPALGENEPKPADMVDLTSDSEDELPLKRKVPQAKGSPAMSAEKTNEDDIANSAGERLSPNPATVISLDSPSPPAATTPPPTQLTITTLPNNVAANEQQEIEVPQAPWAPYADNGGSGDHFRRY